MMERKEFRILEIMDEYGADYDVAEWLFEDELEELYPDVPEPDIREALYELEEDSE